MQEGRSRRVEVGGEKVGRKRQRGDESVSSGRLDPVCSCWRWACVGACI